jgi:hypothetical protein
MTLLRIPLRSAAAAVTAALALALTVGTPASAGPRHLDAFREARLGSSPSVEPLTNSTSRRTPLPLMQRDHQRLRRTDPVQQRCSYLRGRRVCR